MVRYPGIYRPWEVISRHGMIFGSEFVLEEAMSSLQRCHYRAITSSMSFDGNCLTIDEMSDDQRFSYFRSIKSIHLPDEEDENYEMMEHDYVEQRNERLRLFDVEYHTGLKYLIASSDGTWANVDDDVPDFVYEKWPIEYDLVEAEVVDDLRSMEDLRSVEADAEECWCDQVMENCAGARPVLGFVMDS